MDLLTLLTLAVGLAMDAFAVSICKGLAMREKDLKKGIIVGLWFGGFQALTPTIGFFLGSQFKDHITSIDHWIAFVLLGLIGINMVKEALSNDEEQADDSIAVKEMFMLAVATSIDALAVGITFAFLNVHIVSAASMIRKRVWSVLSAEIRLRAWWQCVMEKSSARSSAGMTAEEQDFIMSVYRKITENTESGRNSWSGVSKH